LATAAAAAAALAAAADAHADADAEWAAFDGAIDNSLVRALQPDPEAAPTPAEEAPDQLGPGPPPPPTHTPRARRAPVRPHNATRCALVPGQALLLSEAASISSDSYAPATPAGSGLARNVTRGHYCRVEPSPVADPYLVACSAELGAELGLGPAAMASPTFTETFAGNAARPGFAPFATAYGVSVYGQWATPQGIGYGDGRAASLAEVVSPTSGARWELQLKGSGQTPFCRGADGRAVLRSSLREFIASEAMAALGVPTTRALSLVGHAEEIERPWYRDTAPAPGDSPGPPGAFKGP
jgi:hypothetical protein